MTKKSPFHLGLYGLSIAAASLMSAESSKAASTWDNGGGDQLWSNATNWNPDGAISGLDAIFDATGSNTTAGTVTNIVDSSVSLTSLTYNNVGTATQTTQINTGVTLTAGAFTLNNTGAGASNVTITSLGSLAVTGFSVGVATSSTAVTQILNMSGLSSFTANISGTFGVGTGVRAAGTVTLASSNSITATTLSLGGNTTTGGALSTLNLGQTNTINTNTINVGGGRSTALIQFTSGLTGPTAIIRDLSGTGAAALNASTTTTNASGIGSGTVDFSGGTVDALFSTVNLGTSANSSAGGSGTGTLTFGLGTLTATTMNVGNGSTGTSTTATGIGVVNMNASAGTLTATTVTLGKLQTGARSNSATGTFNQNGGTAAITSLVLAQGSGNTGAGMTTTGTYNLTAGTLKAGSIAPGTNGSGVATYVRSFNWTGGTIQNLNSITDLTIASGITFTTTGPSTQTFSADASRSITVNPQITGTGGFAKAGAGTLTLANTANDYSGATKVNAGTLALGASNVFSNSSALTLNGGTLAAGTFTDTLSTLDLDANSSITLGLASALVFSNSSALDWGSFSLSITGNFTDGSSLRFGTDATGLTSGQLSQISINGSAAALDPSGFLMISSVPESSEWGVVIAGLCGVLIVCRARAKSRA